MLQGSYQNYEFAQHFHTVPAIGVVDLGTMSSYCQSATHILPTGTVLLLNPGEVHAPKPATEKGWGFRMIYFEKEFFRSRAEDFGFGIPQFMSPFVQDDALAASLLRLHRKLENDADALNIEDALADVFTHLGKRHVSEPRNDSTTRDERNKIIRVKDYLHSSYRRNISVEDLAEIAQLSRFHLMRTFRRDVGLSPHAYLTQLRVEAAKKLLSEGASIVDVASDIGFTDQSHLTRHFKRITGVTPGQYLPLWRPNRYPARRLAD
ncbi:MAG TPA: AraC family transcriptional regulator [Edaphobacter sp.]|nr:AraC family transcriptional regulator [Edaphobacter sp.]